MGGPRPPGKEGILGGVDMYFGYRWSPRGAIGRRPAGPHPRFARVPLGSSTRSAGNEVIRICTGRGRALAHARRGSLAAGRGSRGLLFAFMALSRAEASAEPLGKE